MQIRNATGQAAHTPGEKPLARFPWLLSVLVFVPAALLILGGAWFVARDRIQGELDLVRANEISRVVMGVRRLEDGLRAPLRQLRVLVREPALQAALGADVGDALPPMAGLFRTLISYQGIYDKIRWIDQTGRERVRVNNVAGRAGQVPEARLQNLANSYYFTGAMALRPGLFYISPLDLDVEQGRVAVPHKPLLRLAAPLRDRAGQARGILIVDIAAQPLLDAFVESLVEARDHAMLVNKDGYWLSSPEPGDAWGFMLKRGETLGTRHPAAWKAIARIPSGQIKDADGLWTWSTVYPLKVADSREVADVPYWLVISHLPASQLAPVQRKAWLTSGLIALVLLVLYGLFSALLARAVAGRHQAKVEAARAHAEAEAANQLRETQERFRLVVQANTNGLLVADKAGRIVLANPALERMFGYAPDELLGRPLDILLPEAERARHGAQFAHYLSAPEARPMGTGRELHGRRKDGSEFPVEISLSPFTEKGEPYVDAIVADITERKRLEGQGRVAGAGE